MARTYLVAESTGETTRTGAGSDAYTDKVALTLPAAWQTANGDIFLFWSALVKNSGTTDDTKVRLYNDSASVTLQEQNYESKDATDYIPVGGVIKVTSAATPADIDVSLEWANENTASDNAIKEARIIALKRESGDEYAEDLGLSTTSSTSYQTKVTASFTPGSAGDYYILGSCSISNDSAFQGSISGIFDGTNNLREGYAQLADVTNYVAYRPLIKAASLSGSQNWSLRYRHSGGGGAVQIREACVVALRGDTFDDAQYGESTGISKTTSTSYQDKATVTFTPAAVDYLVLGSSSLGHSTTNSSVLARLAKNVNGGGYAALADEGTQELTASDTTTLLPKRHDQSVVQTMAAQSTVFATQYHAEAGTSAISESAIAVLQLQSAGGGSTYTLVPDSVSWSWSATAVSLEFGRELVPGAVSWTWNATNVTLSKGLTFVPGSVAWSWAAQDVSLKHGRELVPSSVAWAFTVTDAGLEHGYELVPAVVSWQWAADNVSLEYGYEIVPENVSWSWTSDDVTLVYGASYQIVPDSAAWAWSATDVSLEFGYELVPDVADWTWGAGADVTLTITPASDTQTAPSYGGTDWERKWKRLADLERAKTSIEAIPADEPEIAEQTLEKIEDDTGIPMPIVVHLDTRSVRAALAEAERRLHEIIVQERRRRNNNWLMMQ